ncbi:GntR family transcriptional regulator [Pseudonocardia sp. NPDC049154]|uniref:GntR family transcriptional regulator n=1 Tax=Pseudonocardia sp. NPDC049154 TaxID=3155501 RepID=UPI0033CF407F
MSASRAQRSETAPGSGGVSLRQLASPQAAAIVELRGQIVDGDLLPGAKIFPDQLARQLGLSKAPVQEALRVLEAGGEVVHRAHQGFSVVELDREELQEIFHLRRMLENDALRQAARRLTEMDLERLAELAVAVAAADPTDRLGQWAAEKRFFAAIFALAGSPREVRLIEQLWGPCAPYTARAISELDLDDGTPAAMVAALRAADSAEAVRLLNERRKHLHDVLKRLV